MGISESKHVNPTKSDVQDGIIPTTPISTNNIPDILDPRSISANVARTPLSFLKNTSFAEGTPSRDEIELDCDPRSPSYDFPRTPIVVTVNKSKIVNKHLTNASQSKISKLAKDCVTPGKQNTFEIRNTPKLLESSPITTKVETKRRSLVGLLETNIDFTETNLDTVIQRMRIGNDSTEKCSPVNTIDKLAELTSVDELPLTLNEERENKPEENNLENISHKPNDKEITEKSDDSINEPPAQAKLPVEDDKSAEVKHEPEAMKQQPIEEKIVNPPMNPVPNIRDFDKKLTSLIYEDKVLQPTKRMYSYKDNVRIPLGTRNTGDVKQNTQKLKVSDKPRQYSVSKIPVFREKNDKKMDIQCENTPPRNYDNRKINRNTIHWDGDKTLLI